MIEFIFSIFRTNLIYPLILPGLVFGVICIVVSTFLPTTMYQIKVPTFFGGILIILFFTFYSGKFSQENIIKAERAKLMLEIADLKAKSNEVTTRTIIKYVDSSRAIQKVKQDFTKNVENTITPSINSKYPNLPNAAIRLLNDAAQGRISNSSGIVNENTTKTGVIESNSSE